MPPFFYWGNHPLTDILRPLISAGNSKPALDSNTNPRRDRSTMRFLDSTVRVFIAQTLSLVGALLVSVAISRVLGAEGKGLVALILATAEILYCLSHLGHGFSVQYFLGKKRGEPRTLLANQLVFPPAMALLVAVVFVAAYPYLIGLLQDTPLAEMYPAALLLIVYMFFQPCCQYLVGRGRVSEFANYTILKSLLTLIFVAIVLFAWIPSVEHVMWGYIAALVIVDALSIRACFKTISGEPLKPSLAQLRETLGYSFWIYASSLIRELAKRVDLVMVFAIQGVGLAGVYSVASNLTAPLVIIPQAVQTVFFPITSSQSSEEAAVTTPQYHRQMILVLLAAAAVVAIFSRPVLALFGPEFLEGQVPLLILLGMAIFRGLTGIVSLHILGRGKAYTVTVMTILVLTVAVVLNAILIPRYGTIGAAVAATGAELVHYVAWIVLYKVVAKGDVGALFAISVADLKLTLTEGINYLRRFLKKD